MATNNAINNSIAAGVPDVDVDQQHIIYVGKHGLDLHDGLTPDKAKFTFGSAITAAAAVPSPAVVKCFDFGTYTEDLTGQVDVAIDAKNAILAGVHTLAAGNRWDFNEATIATGVVGFTFNSAGNICSLNVDKITCTNTGIAVLCSAGDMYIDCREAIIANGAFFGSTGAGHSTLTIGSMIISGTGIAIGVTTSSDIHVLVNNVVDSGAGTLVFSVAGGVADVDIVATHIEIATLSNISATTTAHITSSHMSGTLLESGAGSVLSTISDLGAFGLAALGTNKILANTALFQAYDTAGASYTSFGTLTAGNPPTFDLDDAVTKAANYIYRGGGTDVPVVDGGTGLSATTPYAVLCGGTAATTSLQSIAGVGTAAQVLTSNGAGALPTFQDTAPSGVVWENVTAASKAMVANEGYVANRVAGVLPFTLPATATVGESFAIAGSQNGWTVAQNAGQTIHFVGVDTTPGVGGSLASTTRYDCLEMICIVTDTNFCVKHSCGNITIV